MCSFFLPSFRNFSLFFFPLRARSNSCRAFDTDKGQNQRLEYSRIPSGVKYCVFNYSLRLCFLSCWVWNQTLCVWLSEPSRRFWATLNYTQTEFDINPVMDYTMMWLKVTGNSSAGLHVYLGLRGSQLFFLSLQLNYSFNVFLQFRDQVSELQDHLWKRENHSWSVKN